MKKMMYFAAALLVLVGCQKSQEAKENAPVNYGTITGKIELPQGPNKISATKGWSKSGNIQMQWEEGDEVLIGNESGMKFLTLKSIDGNGVATFEGELLSDMNSYMVYYGFDPFDYTTDRDVPYIEGNYRPFAMGYGTDESFTIEDFSPVFGMPLKGTVALTQIEASYTVALDYNLTMTFETPLQLSSESQIVYFPIYSTIEETPLTFKFYDAGGLILTKTIEEATCDLNQVITFNSDLEVNGTAPAPTYEYVDLGLSVNWATFNVGATTPEGYGDYFAWGETAPYYNTPITDPISWKEGKGTGYYWDSYFDFDQWNFKKYKQYGTLYTLEAEDDAATVNWGGNWRMPTTNECSELCQNCNWEWTTNYNNTGIAGYIVKSKANTNSIFLPATGSFAFGEGQSVEYAKELRSTGIVGCYWSSGPIGTNTAQFSDYISFYHIGSEYEIGVLFSWRCAGMSIRPVCQKGE